MRKHEHKYMQMFTDKVNGFAKIIIVCEKCGATKTIMEYVGDNTPHMPQGV